MTGFCALVTDISAVRPKKSIFQVTLNGHWAVELIDVLYSNCSVALPRKMEVARQILAEFRY